MHLQPKRKKVLQAIHLKYFDIKDATEIFNGQRAEYINKIRLSKSGLEREREREREREEVFGKVSR